MTEAADVCTPKNEADMQTLVCLMLNTAGHPDVHP